MKLDLTLFDVAGLIGVEIILAAYAATTIGRLNPKGAPSLATNFLGASLIPSLSPRATLQPLRRHRRGRLGPHRAFRADPHRARGQKAMTPPRFSPTSRP